jgi:WD40 repeat protein
MKLRAAFLAALALGAFAQPTSTPVVIKREGCFAVMSLAFSPDGSELAQDCGFAPIEIFDTTNYRSARTFRSQIDYTPDLRDFAYSPDGKTMATTRPIIGAEVWNAADPGKPVPPKNGESFKSFYGVDELYALDKPLRVLEAPRASLDEFASALDVGYSPDGKFLFTKYHNGHVKIWDTSSWTLQRKFIVSDKGNSALFSVLGIAPDNKSFVVGDQDGVLHVWNLDSKSETRVIGSPDGGGKMVANLVFSADGKTLVAIHQGKRLADGTAVVWNTTDWTSHALSGYSAAAFSRDGRLLALGGPDIKLFDSASRKELRTIEVPTFTKGEVLPDSAHRPDAGERLPCGVSALAFSPDGETLAFGCFDTLHIMKLDR